MTEEFEQQPSFEIESVEPTADQIGGFAMWADAITDELPFTTGSLRLLESLQYEHPGLEMREEQLECLDAIYEARTAGQERALVQMATGLGKTTVVAADVKRFLNEKPKARVLFLCHQNDILAQARERFEGLVGPDYTYGNFTGESQDYHEVTCLFASFQAMRNWREAFLEDEFDYVVVDESHHGKAPTYEPTLDYFKPQFMLGVTATPDRHDLKDIREIFGGEIYRLPLEEAIGRGLLADVDYRVITDEIEVEKSLETLQGEKLNLKQLNRSIFVPKRDDEIAHIIEEKGEELGIIPRRIIFCPSISYTEEFAKYFPDAVALHSNLSKAEQNAMITAFKNGEVNTILTVDMFNEGIDIPDANQIIFLRSTQSKTVYLQQLGRGLRRMPEKDTVQVLDFVANCERLAMIDELWKTIRQYASESGSDNSENLYVNVGSVEFTEVAENILSILDEIEARNTYNRQLIDEGWCTISGLAKEVGLVNSLIEKAMQALDISAEEITFSSKKTVRYLSAHQQVQIKDWLAEMYRNPDEEDISIVEIRTSLGWGEAKMERILQELNVTPHISRSRLSGRLISYITPQQYSSVLEHPEAQLMLAPDGFTPTNQVAVQLGTQWGMIAKAMRQLGIVPQTFASQSGRAVQHISNQEFARLQDYAAAGNFGQEALTQSYIAKQFNLSNLTVRRIFEAMGIQPHSQRVGLNKYEQAYSPEDLEKFLEHPLLTTPTMPSDYVLQSQIKGELGISQTLLLNLAKDLELEWVQFKHPETGRITRCLPRAEVELLASHPRVATPLAPEGHKNINSLEKELNVTAQTIKKAMATLGHEPVSYRLKGGQLTPHYSPEQIADLRQELSIRFELPTEEDILIKDVGPMLGFSGETVKKMCGTLGIDIKLLRQEDTRSKGRATFISKTDFSRLEEYVKKHLQQQPEDHISLLDTAELAGVAPETVRKIANEYGFEWQPFRNKENDQVKCLSLQQVQKILDHPHISTPYAEQGYMSNPEILKTLGIPPYWLKKAVEALNLTPTQFKNPNVLGRITDYYSTEQVELLKTYIATNRK